MGRRAAVDAAALVRDLTLASGPEEELQVGRVDQPGAALLPYNDKLYNSFSTYRCYNGGQVTNWVHGQDMLQLALGAHEAGPVEIWPADGYQGPPNSAPSKCVTPMARWCRSSWRAKRGPDGGAVFVGEACKVELNFNKVTTNPPDLLKDAPPPMPMPDENGVGLWTAVPHLENWLDCIKTRKTPTRRSRSPIARPP